MPTVKYMWGTPWGTDVVPCEIKEKRGSGYLIEFKDTIADEMVERWVNISELIWPDYSEMILA